MFQVRNVSQADVTVVRLGISIENQTPITLIIFGNGNFRKDFPQNIRVLRHSSVNYRHSPVSKGAFG